jgi:hypothetical protein
MEIHEIEVIIEKNGQLRVQVRGVKGKACLALTRELEAALGGQVLSRQMTAEASETCTQQTEQHLWQRSG